jgi:hypothetical protein
MGNRAVQVVTIIVALAVGGGAAFGYPEPRGSSQQSSTQGQATPTPEVSESPTPFELPSPVPTPSPTQAPTAPPSPPPAPSPTSAAPQPAAYPAQITAGTMYQYSGHGTLVALASDNQDAGTTVCAGITNSGQNIPPGYLAAYYVSVTFRDGNILSAGYVRSGVASQDFGQIQNGGTKNGSKSATPTASGTHTYCVNRTGSSWSMTADGTTIYSTTAEGAANTVGATLRFASSVEPSGSPPGTPFAFSIPGFSNIAIDAKPPTQLRGQTLTF